MECAGHKRVILRRIGKHHETRAVRASGRGGKLRRLFYQNTKVAYRVHVDAGFCCRHIDAAADFSRGMKRIRNGLHKRALALRVTLMNERRVTAYKIYTHSVRGFFQRFCNPDAALCIRVRQQADRRYGNPFIYDRNSIFTGNSLTCRYQILCTGCDLFIDFLI